jgi:hypothetical protein
MKGVDRSKDPILPILRPVVHPKLAEALLFPVGPVKDYPVKERLFEADVPPDLFTFDPFVTEYFFTLRQKFPIEIGIS